MNVQIVKEYPSPFGSDNVALMRGYSKPSSTSAIETTDTLNTAIGKLEKAIESSGGGGEATSAKKRYTISSGSWSASQNASGYYTYSLTLTTAISGSPNVYLAGSTDSTHPTDTEKNMYDLLDRVDLNSSTSLVLSAKTKPTSTFYIWVGCEGGENRFGNLTTLFTKSFAISDISGTSDRVTLSSSEDAAVAASKTVLFEMGYTSANGNYFSVNTILAYDFKKPTASGATANGVKLNYDFTPESATKSCVALIYNNYPVSSGGNGEVYISLSQAYKDNQYSSGHTWYLKAYKIA